MYGGGSSTRPVAHPPSYALLKLSQGWSKKKKIENEMPHEPLAHAVFSDRAKKTKASQLHNRFEKRQKDNPIVRSRKHHA